MIHRYDPSRLLVQVIDSERLESLGTKKHLYRNQIILETVFRPVFSLYDFVLRLVKLEMSYKVWLGFWFSKKNNGQKSRGLLQTQGFGGWGREQGGSLWSPGLKAQSGMSRHGFSQEYLNPHVMWPVKPTLGDIKHSLIRRAEKDARIHSSTTVFMDLGKYFTGVWCCDKLWL